MGSKSTLGSGSGAIHWKRRRDRLNGSRGWLDINTIKKHYLSLTQRSERFQALMQQVVNYATKFNGF
ncbi:hypothetical protein KAS14_05410 [Candidatus Bathyarchaeota archaeon]|nr:hypothetical protein [Candidatus Bathyarchaeota archaeon]